MTEPTTNGPTAAGPARTEGGAEARSPAVGPAGDRAGFLVRPIGLVESPLRDRADAPKQPDEGAPPAWLVISDEVRAGLRGLRPGQRILVLTWLDRSSRDVLTVHSRGDRSRPPTGVFSTRSPVRPNPIGLHEVTIVRIEGTRLLVDHLEALDATPVVDIKPVRGPISER